MKVCGCIAENLFTCPQTQAAAAFGWRFLFTGGMLVVLCGTLWSLRVLRPESWAALTSRCSGKRAGSDASEGLTISSSKVDSAAGADSGGSVPP